MKKSYILLLFLTATILQAQIDTLWTKSYDGYPYEVYDEAFSVKPTNDGGFIIAGKTEGFSNGNWWLIKTDFKGNEEWENVFTYTNNSQAYSVVQSNDDGYALTGYRNGGDYLVILKTDADGNQIWSNNFSTNSGNYNFGRSIVQTEDDGYAVTGSNDFFLWLIKTDSEGNEEWNQELAQQGQGRSIQQTSDGGFIITGYKESNNWNLYLVKTNSNGEEEWNYIYDYNDNDALGNSVYQTKDGGYIIAGIQDGQSSGGGSSGLLIKIDSEGNEEWNQVLNSSAAYDVKQTLDGGYIISGHIYTGTSASSGLRLIKTDSYGNEEYSRTFDGGSYDGDAYEVHQLNAQHYITAGGLNDDAYLMKFIIPWCPIEAWHQDFPYYFISLMITGDMPIDMVYDIDYDGVLTIMDLLIASDISDDAVDSPYDCLD